MKRLIATLLAGLALAVCLPAQVVPTVPAVVQWAVSTGAVFPTTRLEPIHYVASFAVNLPASAQDIMSIQGNEHYAVRITKITVAGYSPATTPVETVVLRRFGSITGGVEVVCAPKDSIKTPPGAVVRYYLTTPCVGKEFTPMGRLNTVFTNDALNYPSVFAYPADECLYLAGPNEWLTLNLNKTSVPGGVAFITIEWNESHD